MILKGRIVTLRPIALEDAEITLRWRQSPRAKFLQGVTRTIEEQKTWIASKQNSEEFNWIIEYKNKPVGMISLHDINHQHRTAIMGRLLIGEQEKVGTAPVAFEAELLLCDLTFEQLGLHRIYGPIMEDNIGMIRTRLYMGWAQEGIFREHYIYDGNYKNAVMFGLLEDEYRTVYRPKLVQFIRLFSNFV